MINFNLQMKIKRFLRIIAKFDSNNIHNCGIKIIISNVREFSSMREEEIEIIQLSFE